jgi:hypothetical protein
MVLRMAVLPARWKRLIVVAGLCVVAILVAAYFGFDSRASKSSAVVASESASGTRASEAPATVAEASSDANSFHKLQLCAYASWELAGTEALSDCKQYEGIQQFEQIYAQCMNGWMNVPNRKVAAQAALSGCGDTTDVEARYFEATKQTAKAGDVDAQMCYLQAEFGALSREWPLTDANVAEYRQLAPGYVEAAFRRGDWRIVKLMSRRSFHPGSGPVTQLDKIGQPETVYRMIKLLRLGATGAYARSLDADLNGMIHPDLVPEAALPADVVRKSDVWARETFNESYSGSAGLTEAPTVCSPGPGQVGSLSDVPIPPGLSR